MDRKRLKIEAKQALETWEQNLIIINQWEADDSPQEKLDEFVNLAIHSTGDINDVLQRVGEWMNEHPTNDDFNELRGDLSTALKESINFRLSNSDYTHHQLFEDIDNIENLIDVNDLFIDDDVVEYAIYDQPMDTNEVEEQLIAKLDEPDSLPTEEPALLSDDLDDFLFDVEE